MSLSKRVSRNPVAHHPDKLYNWGAWVRWVESTYRPGTRVEVVRFVKRSEVRAPELVTTTLGGLTKAVAGTVLAKKAAAFGLGVGVGSSER